MSPPTPPPRLPQELVDTVIDELKSDTSSLRACSLVSKPWIYRSRKHLFTTVNLPVYLLRRWQEHIPADATTGPLEPHHHVRTLSLYPATGTSPFCVPESFITHLSSFTQVSRLIISNSLGEEWADAFSDRTLVVRYFGGFGRTLRKLELTSVYLNTATLRALLDAFPRLEEILIFSPMMMDEAAKTVEALPEHQSTSEAEESSNVTIRAPIRRVDRLTLMFPPKDLVVVLTNLPLNCRELVLAEDLDYGGEVFNLLVDSTGQTLESLAIRSAFDRGSAVTLKNCPSLREVKSKAPYSGNEMLAYIDGQAKLIQTVASPFLGRIVFLGKWHDPQMDRAVDWLEPANWEEVDRELCNLMDRLDEEVKLEVVFADAALSGGDEIEGVGCEQADGAGTMLLKGVKTRGGVVKVQQMEKLE